MARRKMGKNADDQYMGGGTGNWGRAPKKEEKKEPAKKRGVATTEAVKKMKRKEKETPKPTQKSKEDSKTSNAESAKIKKVASKVKSPPSKASPEPSEKAKARVREHKKAGEKDGSIFYNPEGYSPSSATRASVARSGTSDAAGDTRRKQRKAKKSTANKATRTTTKSDKSVTRKRKPLATGARSQNTSGTGYQEGSVMDTLTRVRRGTYKPKKKAPPKKGSRKYMDQSA